MSEFGTPPKVTAGLLCYNAEGTVAAAVACILSQTHKNLEIIIVDDCSTVGSASVLDKFTTLPNVFLIRHSKNMGQGASRNSVLKRATGEFIAFFDDDDISEPDRISVQLYTTKRFEQKFRTENIACFASTLRIYPNGYVVPSLAIGSDSRPPPHGEEVAKYLLAYVKDKRKFYGSGTPTSGLLIRRALLENIGGFDPELRRVEDVDLAVRLALKGCYFVGDQTIVINRYMTQASYKVAEANFYAEQKLAIKHQRFLTKHGLYFHAYTWPRLRYYHFSRKYLSFFICVLSLIWHNPLRTASHLIETGPKRLKHEIRIQKQHTKTKH